jgi:hypothetical protein
VNDGWLRRVVRRLLRRRSPPVVAEEVVAEPALDTRAGELRVVVEPQGLRTPLNVRRRAVYEVTVSDDSGHAWSSRYGFTPPAQSTRAAADAALDELARIHGDPRRWSEEWMLGLSERETEAMRAGRQPSRDVEAARWAGPLLDPLRQRRTVSGSWLDPPSLP